MKQRTKKVIMTVLVILVLLILTIVTLYVNLKNFTVKKVLMPDAQEIYLMGTFHKEHFKRYANYSMEEMINAINNIEPDVVFIEAREDSFVEYGVVDGPIDMCIAYCYCMDKNIPVEMIDYWKIDNDFKENTTTNERDDCIHENIMEKRNLYKNQRILVICGFGHLNAQTNRLIKSGGQSESISHRSSLFDKADKETLDFTYPGQICDVWERRVLFYGHTVPKLVQADDTLNEDTKASWVEDKNNTFYNSQMKYCELFQNNKLYID